MLSAEEALERLKRGNHDFVTVRAHERDLSSERIEELYAYGQNPFAVVVSCADSRTVPEHMFMMGLGDLFVVRTAGNVVGPVELASVVYACEHLGVKLVLVVGHTGCGAIQATIDACDGDSGGKDHAGSDFACGDGAGSRTCRGEDARSDGAGGDTACGEGARSDGDRQTDVMAPLTAPIARAIGDERDPYRASERNVRAGMAALASSPQLADLCGREGLRIAGAVYHTHSGVVDFLE